MQKKIHRKNTKAAKLQVMTHNFSHSNNYDDDICTTQGMSGVSESSARGSFGKCIQGFSAKT